MHTYICVYIHRLKYMYIHTYICSYIHIHKYIHIQAVNAREMWEVGPWALRLWRRQETMICPHSGRLPLRRRQWASAVWRDSFICATCLIHMTWRNYYVTWFARIRDAYDLPAFGTPMICPHWAYHSNVGNELQPQVRVWHDSLICVYVRHASFIWHDAFIM